MEWSRVAGGFCIIVGLSLLAGFITQFRERLYVGLLGLCFIVLAAAAFVSDSSTTGRNIAMIIAGVLFMLAFIFAVLETRERLAALRRRHDAFEEQMLAMMEAEMEKNKKKDEGERTCPPPAGEKDENK